MPSIEKTILLFIVFFVVREAAALPSHHDGNCVEISKRAIFLQLSKPESFSSNRSPKGETVSFLGDFASGEKHVAPFKYYTNWERLFENASPKLSLLVRKALERTEEIFNDVLRQLKEGHSTIAVSLDLAIFREGRKVLLQEWPHLRRQPPEDLSQAVACYCLSYYNFVEVIEPTKRRIERRSLGWGARAKTNLRPYTMLVGYQGLEYKVGDLSEELAERVREMNNESSDSTYGLSVDGYPDYTIDGAPAVAIYHGRRIVLLDKKTRVSFALGALVNGSNKRNVEWAQIEVDGQPLVMLFTTREIKKGEELFVYYGDDYMAEMADPIYS